MQFGDDFTMAPVDYSFSTGDNVAAADTMGAPMTSSTPASTPAFQTPSYTTSPAADYAWLAPVAQTALQIYAQANGIAPAQSQAGQQVRYVYNSAGQPVIAGQASVTASNSNLLLIGGGLLLLLLLR